MTPEYIQEIQEAIRGEGLDGWLFCNFRHRDPLADAILGINPASTNSRLWVYAIPVGGKQGEQPLAILHGIEPDAAGAAVGERVYYQTREELLARLAALAGKRWGCNFSDTITAVSYLDAGTAATFGQAGLKLVSAAGLLQRFKGLLKPAAMEAHERAAAHLYEIVEIAWANVREAFAAGTELREGGIQQLMLDEFAKRELVNDHPPIVAAGANSANPHYDIPGGGMTHNGALLKNGDVVQFDLWAKKAGAGGIYADISWVGVYAKTPPPDIEQTFENLVLARETALYFIDGELRAGRVVSGAAVDEVTRWALGSFGYTGAIRHRTGHGIDTEAHGYGVNMDSVEFPDARPVLEGSCFSLEPGIYFEQFGLRTEINVYIKNGVPVVSGKERQFHLLHC